MDLCYNINCRYHDTSCIGNCSDIFEFGDCEDIWDKEYAEQVERKQLLHQITCQHLPLMSNKNLIELIGLLEARSPA